MKVLIVAAMLAASVPAHAGGPVIVEDESEVIVRKPGSGNWVVPALVLVAILALANNGGNCYAPDDPVSPDPCD